MNGTVPWMIGAGKETPTGVPGSTSSASMI